MMLTTAASSPTPALIDKGEAGIAIYGLLFVIGILSALLWRAITSINQRDKLIEAMIERQAASAERQADGNITVAVALANLTSAMNGSHAP